MWPGYQRPLDQTELASFAYVDLDGPVCVEILSRRPVESVKVRPLSTGIHPVVNGQAITLYLDRPQHLVVEVNGWHNALHLFANPPENEVPDKSDPRVHYHGPGIHQHGK